MGTSDLSLAARVEHGKAELYFTYYDGDANVTVELHVDWLTVAETVERIAQRNPDMSDVEICEAAYNTLQKTLSQR